MRSLIILFAIAALGFVIILQKHDAPEAAKESAKPSNASQLSQHNWMKQGPDRTREFAQNLKQRRGSEIR